MMSEKLCLQWNNFKDIKNSAFGNLSNNVDFADVTLTCGKSEIFYGDNTEKSSKQCSVRLQSVWRRRPRHPHSKSYRTK